MSLVGRVRRCHSEKTTISFYAIWYYPRPAPAGLAETLAALIERVTYPQRGERLLRVARQGAGAAGPDHHLRPCCQHLRRRMGADERHLGQRPHPWPAIQATFLKATPPTTLEGIEKYLGSGMIRGIGLTHDPAASRKPSHPPATTPKAAYSASRNASSDSTMMYHQACRP